MTIRALTLGVGILGCATPPACGGEAPPPLVTGDPAPAHEPVRSESTGSAAPDGLAAGRTSGLWFDEGPGREALLARERRDYERARQLLDELLADPDLSVDDRGAALVLRGIEMRRADEFEAAAGDFEAARKSPGLAPIEAWIAMQQARALLDAGKPEEAADVLAFVADAGADQAALQPDRFMAEASARSRTEDTAGAIELYRAFLKAHGRDDRRFEARVRLAALLEPTDPEAAVELYEGVLVAVPLSDYGDQAKAGLKRLQAEGHGKRTKKQAATYDRELELAELEARLSRRQYRQVVEDAAKYVRRKDVTAKQKCRAYSAKGKAVFQQHKRAAAQPHYDAAAKACAAAGDDDGVVKARYQSARGAYAEGKYAKAAEAFEKLATDFPKHSYADDALVLAGESWESAGEAGKARKAWQRAIDEQPTGDMGAEVRRRLLVQDFAEKRYDDALKLTDKILKQGLADRRERAKLHYFRGRALQRLGRQAEAEEAWIAAIQQMPLCYPSLQALSRLRDSGEGALAQGLSALEGASRTEAAAPPKLELPDVAPAVRAEIFARLGLGAQARAELEAADIDGWPAAAVLAKAGLYDASQRVLANLGTGWRGAPPTGVQRPQYEVAHPVPFAEIIEPGEKRHGVQPLLTFAIMQTESRFNPAATSWAGARGLVQLMPKTAEGLARGAGVQIDEKTIYDPELNLDLGMRYLARLEQRWGKRDGAVALAISSYNGGAGNVDKWLAQRGEWDLDLFIESIPFDETRRYTQHVLGRWMAYRWLYGDGQPSERLPYLPLDIPEKG